MRAWRCWVTVLAAAVAVTVRPAVASDEGQIAADQVSESWYRYFLGDTVSEPGILYTHTGDDRGYGPEHDLARDNILAAFLGFGLSADLEAFSYSGNTYHNVVAEMTGTVDPAQVFIIGGHYDSVNNPGADDNASGVAAVLEAARVLSQYGSDYTIRFIAFDREEQGLIGSNRYVTAHVGDDIQGMVAADMLAYDTGSDSSLIYGRSASNPIKTAVAQAVTAYGGLSYTIAGQLDGSDHAPFEGYGFQACLLIEGETWSNPYYHTQQDAVETVGNINYPFAVKMTRSLVGWLVDQAGVQVPVNTLNFTYPNGQPEFVSPAGGTTMRVEVIGVGSEVPQPGTGFFHYDTGGGWQSAAMDVVADNVYEAVFPAASCGGEVLYYVSAEAVGGGVFTDPRNAPSTVYSATASYGQTVAVDEPLDSNPLWTTQGQWAYGQPAGLGGQYGGPDPSSGHTGPNVYGYNLNGDYPNGMSETHLTTDPIDCTGLFDVHLKFWRWLGVEQPAYDHAYVRVSNNGTDWITAWQNSAEIADTQWVEMDLDISAVADDQPTIYLRWTMGSSDGGWTYCGWNIDDIQLVAADCSGPPAVITGAWSCLKHGSAGDLCLELDSVNIEPRRDGVQTLEFDVSEAVATVGASVVCDNYLYFGTAVVTPSGTTVTVDLDPVLPDQDCCTVTLTGDVADSFAVRTLSGDVDRNGVVATTDAGVIKPYFGQSADVNNAVYDYDCNGTVATTDFGLVKPRFGNAAPPCP